MVPLPFTEKRSGFFMIYDFLSPSTTYLGSGKRIELSPESDELVKEQKCLFRSYKGLILLDLVLIFCSYFNATRTGLLNKQSIYKAMINNLYMINQFNCLCYEMKTLIMNICLRICLVSMVKSKCNQQVETITRQQRLNLAFVDKSLPTFRHCGKIWGLGHE